MNLQATIRAKRRSISLSLCCFLLLQTFMLSPVNADLDFWTKLKLIGFLALTKKIELVPIPLPIPFPIHLEGKDEVVYLKSPPPISSAYSYMTPHMPDYGHSHYSAKSGNHGGSGHHSGGKQYSDTVGHASEIVPIVASASLQYGARIPPPGSAPPPQSAPAQSAKPIHRHRTNRNRNLNRPRPGAPYVPPTTTTPSPPPAVFPITDDYSYQPPATSYEAELSKPQIESTRFAAVPVKATELTQIDQNQQQQVLPPKQSSDSALPENLLNYIRQVQGLPEITKSDVSQTGQSAVSGEPTRPAGDSLDQTANRDKYQPSANLSEVSEPVSSLKPPSANPESVPLLTQLPPQQSSLSIEHKQNVVVPVRATQPSAIPISTAVQSQWQQNYSPVSVAPTQYQASDYAYRPPELKVITNLPRWQPPKEPLKKLRPQTPVIASLHQSIDQPVNIDPVSQPDSNQLSGPLQKSQFIYSVSHASNPPAPTSYFSGASRYPSVDHFGLDAFRQSQQPQSQQLSSKPNSYLPPSLAAAASVESVQWMKPTEKGGKSKFLNNFGHRLSRLF